MSDEDLKSFKTKMVKYRARMDQSWASLRNCLVHDPDAAERMLEVLHRQDWSEIRNLPDEDLKLVCSLAIMGLDEGLMQAATAVTDATEAQQE